MLNHELLDDVGVLVLKPEEALASSDFQTLAAEIDPYLESTGSLRGLLVEAVSFPGWSDFGALLSHLRFVRDHHRKIRRIALVSDSGVLSIVPRISEHFVSADVRHFDAADRGSAMDWLIEE